MYARVDRALRPYRMIENGSDLRIHTVNEYVQCTRACPIHLCHYVFAGSATHKDLDWFP